MRRLLVVGARDGGLGSYVREMALAQYGPGAVPTAEQWKVSTAGVSGEDYELDITGPTSRMVELLDALKPHHVVCTAGINKPRSNGLANWYEEHFSVNCVGPMRLLGAWLMLDPLLSEEWRAGHYVAISSNSAQVARTNSDAYCASKAALSMALRCKARALAGKPVVVYGYEPGLIAGTQMTQDASSRFRGKPLTRMPGLTNGISPHQLAGMVVRNLAYGDVELNGCMLRVDAGDQ